MEITRFLNKQNSENTSKKVQTFPIPSDVCVKSKNVHDHQIKLAFRSVRKIAKNVY
jgi:hypothetical protein